MRVTKTYRVITAAVMTTVATATVVTFARGDGAPPAAALALPAANDEVPTVADPTRATPGAAEKRERAKDDPTASPTDDPTPSSVTEPAGDADDPASPRSSGGTSSQPTPPGGDRPAPAPSTTPPPAPGPDPSPEPEPSPTPKPPKNLLELLLGL